jgi:hypothetical protein
MKKEAIATMALKGGRATLAVKPGSVVNQSITIIYGGGTGYRTSAHASRRLATRLLAAPARGPL